jgi:hypothetical protein
VVQEALKSIVYGRSLNSLLHLLVHDGWRRKLEKREQLLFMMENIMLLVQSQS